MPLIPKQKNFRGNKKGRKTNPANKGVTLAYKLGNTQKLEGYKFEIFNIPACHPPEPQVSENHIIQNRAHGTQ